MKKKNLMTAVMCAVCMAASAAAPLTVMAEETTELVTEAADEAAADTEGDTAEEITEAGTGAEEETDAAETEAPLERPDYNALDYVTLGEYKGLNVVLDDMKATDEEINEEIRSKVRMADALETLTEGTVQTGDTANIDYEGKLDGVAFDGGTAKGYDLEIGSHSFIDGFEDGLVGVSVGETIDLPLTFPEQYFNADLAGKEVIFTVTVNEIKRMPELSDELISTITDGEYTDVASYKEFVRADIENGKEGERDNMIKADIMTQIANNSKINKYPEELVAYGEQGMKEFYYSQADAYEMAIEDFLSMFLGMTLEEFNEQVTLAVQQSMQQELYLKAIAETEGIELSDEEFTAGCEKLLEENPNYETQDDLLAYYGEGTVRISLLQEKVMNFLAESAVVTEAGEAESETEAETE